MNGKEGIVSVISDWHGKKGLGHEPDCETYRYFESYFYVVKNGSTLRVIPKSPIYLVMIDDKRLRYHSLA